MGGQIKLKKMQNKTKILFFFLILCGIIFSSINVQASQSPVVLFSDLTDAPVSGWEGSATKGAAVSIWGRNLGSGGVAHIDVCGQEIASDSADVVEWGVVNIAGENDPADVYLSSQGLERITFHLNSNMTIGAGKISVTTADGVSSGVDFYCRDNGNIYFVDDVGSADSYNGKMSSYQGNISGPWATLGMAKKTLTAGDVCYIRAGIHTAVDQWGYDENYIMDFWTGAGANIFHNGTVNNSIAIVAYPGEIPQIGDIDNEYVMIFRGSTPGTFSHWTFGKMMFRSEGNNINSSVTITAPLRNDYLRFVGIDFSTVGIIERVAKTAVQISGNANGSEYIWFLGNNFHDLGVNDRDGIYYASGGGYPIYLGGFGWHRYTYIGYNEMHHNPQGRLQVYGHYVTDWADEIYIYNNYIHDQGRGGAVIGGGDGNGGSYDYSFVQDLYFFNNVVSNNSGDGITVGGVNYGGSGRYKIYNNTLYENANVIHMIDDTESADISNNIFYSSTSFFDDGQSEIDAFGRNNVWYGGASDYPTWDSGDIATDPKFTGSEDYSLQYNSAAIDAGVDLSAILTNDIVGTVRPQGVSYDIGAFEYTSAEKSIETCSDNIQNQDETGIDCGGVCDACVVPATYNLTNFISAITNWLQIGNTESDVNSDGIVNTRDLGVVMSGWGE
ncbi:MAG: hypothetical protein US37_C0007G0023 [Candidatus Moranbacteria bacterium GW2011_GWF2_37_11]|nr:MAG: hypothetical protein US37_C0007G0023 [Candidatus Moranbacteria bacterium GW2011_GWF2_37_11]